MNNDENIKNLKVNIQDYYPSEMLDGSRLNPSPPNINLTNQASTPGINDNGTNSQNNANQNTFNNMPSPQSLIENLVKNILPQSPNNLLSSIFSNSNNNNALMPMLSGLLGQNNANIMSLFNQINSKNSTEKNKKDAKRSKIADYEIIEKE